MSARAFPHPFSFPQYSFGMTIYSVLHSFPLVPSDEIAAALGALADRCTGKMLAGRLESKDAVF